MPPAVLSSELRNWAITNSIRHSALGSLLSTLQPFVEERLPKDARTLLRTPKAIHTVPMGDGNYWYYGLENCLSGYFENINESMDVLLSFNIDGLPIGSSSKKTFWPILVHVNGVPQFKPMVVSIWCGEGKPKIELFLQTFIEDLIALLENGIQINENIKLTLKISNFICDSPARAYIKDTIQFNGYHGCQLCYVVGEYDKKGKRMSFPDCYAALRSDDDFRNRVDPDHHKSLQTTPLEQLNINMVTAIISADELHLLHLGVMKRMLHAWVMPKRSTIHKWTRAQIEMVNSSLDQVKLPTEIHRAMRTLGSVKVWKGLEYRNFLMYTGIVILLDVYPRCDPTYKMFCSLFTATTICSSDEFKFLLEIAEQCFLKFVRHYMNVYGKTQINSNVHNCIHIVDQVREFGVLNNFSAYRFENQLYQLKRKVRHGNNPLAQVAARIIESRHIEKFITTKNEFPIFKKKTRQSL